MLADIASNPLSKILFPKIKTELRARKNGRIPVKVRARRIKLH